MASGYLLKDSDCEQITKAIVQVHDGFCPVDPSLTRQLLTDFAKISQDNRCSILTKRQTDVLRLIADGMSSREIGSHLFISTSRVKKLIRQILNQLKVSDHTQAVSEAMKRKLI